MVSVADNPDLSATDGRRLVFRGRVQGVGFRPFLARLCSELSLSGEVYNTRHGVELLAWGPESALDILPFRIRTELPAAARIDELGVHAHPPPADTGTQLFRILDSITESQPDFPASTIPLDRALCRRCIQELFSPGDRRYYYPFIHCSECGPRYSLLCDLPFDRHRTSMRDFPFCATCNHEYRSPRDRRFHTQTVCCPDCGPRLIWMNSAGEEAPNANPVEAAIKTLQAGGVVVIKGVGGCHLMADARNPDAVARIRALKQRPEKPLAVMALNPESLTALVDGSEAARPLLTSAAAPIVLLPAKAPKVLQASLFPGLDHLGVMLPYLPVHFLLFHQWLDQPAGSGWLEEAASPLLICTSANDPGGPILTGNLKATELFAGRVDGFLLHDRPIVAPVEDPVIQRSGLVIRSGRGLSPIEIAWPLECEPGLACGASIKGSVCLVKGDRAYLSPPLGELDHPGNARQLETTVQHLQQLLGIKPHWIACDRHPDFISSRYARERAHHEGLSLVLVPHHQAHACAVLAEHGRTTPIIAAVLDGFGLGEDTTAWGGELFQGAAETLEHIGQMQTLRLPGGDRAVKDIWRLAAALPLPNNDSRLQHWLGKANIRPLDWQCLTDSAFSPPTSSTGRWFDAVAALLRIRESVSYDGQAAAELETLARKEPIAAAQGLVSVSSNLSLQLSALWSTLANSEATASLLAARFHSELTDGLKRWILAACSRYAVTDVVLGGGCFQNQLLREQLTELLGLAGLKVLLPLRLPCNDEGLSVGQAWWHASQQHTNP